MTRKRYHRLTAQERLTVRYLWLVHSPPVPISLIMSEFDIARQSVYEMTTPFGLRKCSDDQGSRDAETWLQALTDLYNKERGKNEESDARVAFIHAVEAGDAIAKRYEEGEQHVAVE